MQVTPQDEVLVRLKLAQDILEASENYNQGEYLVGKISRFKKHCWESLVLYLLLTCFDKLGEAKKNPGTFRDWLEKNRDDIKVEPSLTGADLALYLLEQYEAENLVKTRFYRGFNKIPDDERLAFIKELRVFEFIPPHASGEMLSEIHPDTEKIKISCLYDLRNCFTHNLEHNKGISMPINDQWAYRPWAQLTEEGFKYMGYLQHITKFSGKKYVVDFYGLIFPLFKAIYAAVEIDFDVTTINVKFDLFLQYPDSGQYECFYGVPHHKLAESADFMRALLAIGVIKKIDYPL